MLARVATFAIDGFEPRRVTVEVDVRPGLPAFAIVGLADTAVREARERVRPAILNSGFEFPQRRITANLAPAHMRKVGPGFDLALAIALLAASGQVPAPAAEGWAVLGELSLTGEVPGCRGALAVAEGARECGLRGLIVPRAHAGEAALVEGVEVVGVATLRELVDFLAGRLPISPPPAAAPTPAVVEAGGPDLADVRGHGTVIPALEVAAAGGHNLLLEGPPGTGKTMLARRLPEILPPPTRAEALEITRIHSIVGLHVGGALVARRPFRAPHHTTSASGLIGGGPLPSPGEVTLAHHGVLFLDELSEFSRKSLEALRQPLEDGRVAIVRAQRALVFPARFMLVGAANPCPCGYVGDDRCRCGEVELDRHARRLSGPLLDRIDLAISVQRPSADDLAAPAFTSSAAARQRVIAARERQTRRLADTGQRCNGELDARLARRTVVLTTEAEAALRRAYEREQLSARGHHRVLRIARTIADLAGRERVSADHVRLALQYRRRPPVRGQPAPAAAEVAR